MVAKHRRFAPIITLTFRSFVSAIALIGLALLAPPVTATAGVFNIPHFVQPKEFSIGLEPEIHFRPDTSAGANARFSLGLTDQNNVGAILGTGGGQRALRAGGFYTFDVFPDIDNQPGIGLALQALFVRIPTSGSLELTAIPYIHKTFNLDSTPIEPFIAVPLGITLYQGIYQNISTIAVGTLVQHNEHFRTVYELGFGLSKNDTYFSGGLVYYH